MDLSQLGSGQFLIVAVGGLFFLIILVVITLLVRGKLVLKRKDTSIELDVRKGGDKTIVIDPSDPAGKPLKLSGRHVLLIVEKTTEITEERCRIELIEILRGQLNYAEQKLSFTKNTMKQIYLDKLREGLEAQGQNGATAHFHRDFIYYNLMLDILERQIMHTVRAIFKDEGIPQNPSDLTRFIEEKTELINQEVKTYVNSTYIFDEIITRNDISEINARFVQENIDTFRSIFQRAFEIAEEQKRRCEALKDELQEFLTMHIYSKREGKSN